MSNKKVLSKEELEELLSQVYVALCEKGYDSSSQIAGYILSEDPIYVPDWNNARSDIQRVDRDELLRLLIDFYIENKLKKHDQIDSL